MMSTPSLTPCESGLTTQRHFPGKCFFLCITVLLFIFVSMYTIGQSPDFNLTSGDVLALSLTCATILFLLGILFDNSENAIGLELDRPFSLYCGFYLFYYALPNWLVILSNAPARQHAVEISGLTACALFCTYIGYRISGYRPSSKSNFQLTPPQIRALLSVFYLSMPLTLWYHIWHISIGAFYTHARDYVQDPTLFASFMENFAGQLQMPMLLVIGLINYSVRTVRMKWVFISYSCAVILINLFSSQFRLVAGTVLFVIVCVNLPRRRLVKFGAYGFAAAGVGLSLFIILGIRSVALHDDWSTSQNQLADSISAISNQSYATGDVQQQTFERALNQQNLVSSIMDAVEGGHPYLYGELLLDSAYSVIPRFVWPEKPTVVPMQRAIRIAFNMPDQDDSPGPLVEFYANGGWPVVALGFLTIGFSLGWITKIAVEKKTISLFLGLSFYWVVTSIMEGEIVISMVTAFRVVLILSFCAWTMQQLFLQARTNAFASPLPEGKHLKIRIL